MQDNPLVAGFGKLRHELAAVKNIHSLDAPSLLAPFLLVLQAKGTAAPITILALGALRKFLAYGFIGVESPRIAVAMQSLSAAVTHCQFDVSDSAQGEVVLLMILNLMEDMMSGPGGHILSDESVCDMMGRGLAICSQPRFSPVLRRTAEASMVRMCQIIFEDVKYLDETDELVDPAGSDRRFYKMEQPAPIQPPANTLKLDDDVNTADASVSALSAPSTPLLHNLSGNHEGIQKYTPSSEPGSDHTDESHSMDLKPYSLPSGNEAVLGAFMDQFDFAGKRIDEALRVLLETFRLPGEAPLIASIVESFSEKYCRCSTLDEVANADAVFILTYAIIILNTDQHNPNLKASKRMTFDDFSRNLRGQNNGQDFTRKFLLHIFDSIRSNEIILPDEHDNRHAFDYAWRELISKSESAGSLVICDTNIYDADMFASTWRPVVSTLSYVFMSASDDAVFARIVAGFDDCARVAARYENTDALDQLVYCLSLMSTLASDISCKTSLNTEVQVGSGSVMVSELAVKLGTNFRAQLAMLVLFRVVTSREAILRRSWKYIITIWRNLFVNSLIPSLASEVSPSLSIPSIPLQTPSQTIDRAARSAESGFLSAFTYYISSYAADDPPEPSEEELDSTLCTIDCIKSCRISKVFRNILTLPAQSVLNLVQALLEQIPENDQTAVISVKQDTATAPVVNSQNTSTVSPAYDPSILFVLEFGTLLATRDRASMEAVGKDMFDALQTLLRDFSNWHPILISRATFYALLILKHGYDFDFINVPFLLHSINSLPKGLLLRASEIVLKGLSICTDQPGPLRSEIMTSPDFWAIMRVLAGSPESAALVFDIIEKGNAGSPHAIMAENYEPVVSLLVYFAAAAKPYEASGDKGVVAERKADGVARDPFVDKQSVVRACRAVDILHGMTSRVPQLMQQSHLESSEAWSAYWLPIFQALTTLCTNSVRDVRQLAYSSMQRSLLSPAFACSDAKNWTAVFNKVLFPLIFRLLKPEVFSLDREGMSDMRVQSASLLCKVFLQYLVLFSDWTAAKATVLRRLFARI
ncbi:Sec7 domain-containing protein [Ophiocordyceps camponoti-floridani]|uniref:Sec7 domain-containing protein n=1 Tax=Ophiocordyceps camponoti-floridani TaxID=2030778 RepID=A0A8H4Q3N1_9HYPO|nr:Sec7 domain-containing protein [Ophiocordyceps camponoti-floridani]